MNFYRNIVPQKRTLNRGAWLHLESSIRDLVDKYGVVWVMTGSLYESVADPLPQADEDHAVPSGFWKIVAVMTEGEIKIAGFLFSQDTPSNAKLIDHLKPITEIQDRSGLDFLRLLPANAQAALESGTDSVWVQATFRR